MTDKDHLRLPLAVLGDSWVTLRQATTYACMHAWLACDPLGDTFPRSGGEHGGSTAQHAAPVQHAPPSSSTADAVAHTEDRSGAAAGSGS